MSVSEYEFRTTCGCVSLRLLLQGKGKMGDEDVSTNLLPYAGLSELRDKNELIKAMLAEILCTLLLVMIGCGSSVGGDQFEAGIQLDDQSTIIRISLSFGLTVAGLSQALAQVSGGHINPAVTFLMVLVRKIGMVRGILYIVCQCTGGILGAALLCYSLPLNMRGATTLGSTLLGNSVTPSQALLTELVITLLFLFGRITLPKSLEPLGSGIFITAGHLYALPVSGASMNPARSLGPALLTGNWKNHWIFWVGPLLGAVLSALMYRGLIKRGKTTMNKITKEANEGDCSNCQGDDERWRDEESPPYIKKEVPMNATPYSVIATQETDGKELVWIETQGQ